MERRLFQTVVRILFICHGNICRSPAAEMVLRTLMPDAQVDSAATTTEEIGNGIYPPMRRALERSGDPCSAAHRTPDERGRLSEL